MDGGFTTTTGDDGLGTLTGWSSLVVVGGIILVELALLQAFSVGVTTGIYYLIPLLGVGEPKNFADWRSIFQVVGATLTLPGGGLIVLSIYLMERRARQAERRAAAIQEKAASEVAAVNEKAAADVAAANERADKVQAQVDAAREQASTAQADAAAAREEVAALRTQLERRPRRRRRPLRSQG